MMKKNFVLYSLLSLALLSSTAMAMEEKEATEEVRRGAPGKLSIEVTNNTGEDYYQFRKEGAPGSYRKYIILRNFRVRVVPDKAETKKQFPAGYHTGELKKLNVPLKSGESTTDVQRAPKINVTKTFAAYVSSDQESDPPVSPAFALGCVEFELDSQVEVDKVNVKFLGIKEKVIGAQFLFLPDLSLQINDDAFERLPQKFVRVEERPFKSTIVLLDELNADTTLPWRLFTVFDQTTENSTEEYQVTVRIGTADVTLHRGKRLELTQDQNVIADGKDLGTLEAGTMLEFKGNNYIQYTRPGQFAEIFQRSRTEQEKSEVGKVRILMKNNTGKEIYTYPTILGTLKNFRAAIDTAQAKTVGRSEIYENLYIPQGFGKEVVAERVFRNAKATQFLTAYLACSVNSEFLQMNSQPYLFGGIEVDFGTPIPLTDVNVNFLGIEERFFQGEPEWFPRLQIEVNDLRRGPMTYVKFPSGKRFSLNGAVESAYSQPTWPSPSPAEPYFYLTQRSSEQNPKGEEF
jgi:hypothetical protein